VFEGVSWMQFPGLLAFVSIRSLLLPNVYASFGQSRVND
jgi:hypothetical protein